MTVIHQDVGSSDNWCQREVRYLSPGSNFAAVSKAVSSSWKQWESFLLKLKTTTLPWTMTWLSWPQSFEKKPGSENSGRTSSGDHLNVIFDVVFSSYNSSFGPEIPPTLTNGIVVSQSDSLNLNRIKEAKVYLTQTGFDIGHFGLTSLALSH